MILSSPFSRQSRSHQSWANGTSFGQRGASPRKPPPQQPAPQQPKPNNEPPLRSQTLSRLDMQRARQQQRSGAGRSLQRNQSALGHYSHQPSEPSLIYAPASIASPTELHYRQPLAAESQHYAATSFRGRSGADSSVASDSGRSGRESALGSLFGTLRRKAKWTRTSRKPAALESPSGRPASTNGFAAPAPATATAPATTPPAPLDPEIYGTGKKKVEVEAIYAEGLLAIDSNIQKRLLRDQLELSLMSEGETRTLVEERSQRQPDYQQLVGALLNWINDELAQQRIIVKDLQEDLHDGQILGMLIEKLHQIQLDVVEVTQNESVQRHKLRTVLETINRILSLQARWAQIKWSVDGIHAKNMVEIVNLLVTLARYYRAPVKLPQNVLVRVLVVQKIQNQLVERSHEVQLMDSSQAPQLDGDKTRPRDAFDTLVEFAPDKLRLVKQTLVNFANRHLNKINMTVQPELEPDQFSDGLLLVFLLASLEDYFVPLGNLFTAPAPDQKLAELELDANNNTAITQTAIQPTSYTNTQPIHKLHNVNLAFQLMEEAGVAIREQVRPEDIVNGDLKSLLRVLYALFSRYKSV